MSDTTSRRDGQLHEILQRIASSLDTHDALKAITAGACRLVHLQYAIIWTLEDATLVPAAWAGFSPEEAGALRFSLGSGVAGTVALGDDLVESDITTESKMEYRPLANRHGLRTAVHVPLKHADRVLGVLALADRDLKPLSPAQRSALRTMAAFAAIALRNAGQYAATLSAERLTAMVFDGMEELVYVVDLQGRVVRANRGVLRALGRSLPDLVGRPAWSAILGVERPEAAPETSAIGDRRACRTEVALSMLGGGTWQLAASPVFDELGSLTGAVVVGRDVTDLKRIERRLAEAEKITAIGRLVSGVAHELNNPLSSILGFAELLGLDPSGPEAAAQARIIAEEARRAGKIVKNLLTFARQQPPERIPCRIDELVDRVLELLAYEFRTSQVTPARDIAADIGEFVADPHQIQQVLINLISNAVYAMRERGGRGLLAVRARRKDKLLRLEIEDNGPGLPAPVMDRLFEPFVTTKPPGKGTGLGLSVCYGIVREHGGQIRAENVSAGGCRFTVEFPIEGSSSTTRVERTPEGDTTKNLRAARNLRILVVDDEPAIRDFVRSCLADHNEVTVVSDAASALAAVRQHEFDVVLCDVQMPDVDGRELFRMLVQHWGGYADRVALMTGDLASEETRVFMNDFALPVLEKPFQRRDVFKAVIRIVNRQGGAPVDR